MQQAPKLDSLTGIRALAAFWVVLHHYPVHQAIYPYSLVDYGILGPVFHKGYLGVDLFFVLSGFIISYVHQYHFAHWDFKRMGQFLCLRMARLYPVHIVMLFAGLLNFGLLKILTKGQLPQPQELYLPEQFVMALLNIHAWGLGISGGNWNGPSWSISAEWFAYLLFPAATCLFWRKPKSSFYFIALMSIGLFAAVLAVGASGVNDFLNSYALVRVMFGFSWGVLIYNLFKLDPSPAQGWDLGAAICLVCQLCLFYFWPNDLAVVLLFVPFLYCLSRSAGWFQKIFSHPVLVHLGDISYSVYLVHGIFLLGWTGIVIRNVLVPMKLGMAWHLGLFIASLGIVLVCSELMYRYVELPARNYFRGRIDRAFAQEEPTAVVQAMPADLPNPLPRTGSD